MSEALEKLCPLFQAGYITATKEELNKAADGIDTTAGAKMLQMQSNTVAYTDVTAKDLFTLPANAVIDAILIYVGTAFNDTGNDHLDIGKKGGDADYYVADQDVATTGTKWPTCTNMGGVGASAVTITGTYAGANSDATAGSATVTVIYHMP